MNEEEYARKCYEHLAKYYPDKLHLFEKLTYERKIINTEDDLEWCTKCKKNTMRIANAQVRSADEGETTYLICTICSSMKRF